MISALKEENRVRQRQQQSLPQRLEVAVKQYDWGPFVVGTGGLPGLKSLKRQGHDDELLVAFGVESSNYDGFHTLEHSGLRAKILAGNIDNHADGYCRDWNYSVGDHEFHAVDSLVIKSDRLIRTLEIGAASDVAIPIFDAVLRWGFQVAAIRNLAVGDVSVPYRRRNLYHQYPVESVTFDLCGQPMRLQTVASLSLPAGMQQVMYARDAAEGWIVHHRVITERPDQYYVRGCCRLWQGVVKTPSAAWHCLPPLRNAMYLIRERYVPRFPIQLMGDVVLRPGEKVCLQHELVLC